MPSPFTRDQLSPAMQARYGLDRSRHGIHIAVAVIVIAFVAALIYAAIGITSDRTANRLLQWRVVAPDHVSIRFQATADTTRDVNCVLRAQDEHRIDVGYAKVTLPPDPEGKVVVSTYELRTLAPAYTAELLGCAAGAPAAVPPPQFPPGVVAPDQPYR